MSEENSEEIISFCEEYRADFVRKINQIDLNQVNQVLKILIDVARKKNNVFVCGNGGSGALAQHFAVDLGVGTNVRINGHGAKIFDLNSNSSIITAMSNDISFDDVFSSQLELLGKKNDLLITISSSGNSKNIINAITKAHELGIMTIGFTGFDGGKSKCLVKNSIHIETAIGDYGRVEDAHSFVLHLLTALFRIYRRDSLWKP